MTAANPLGEDLAFAQWMKLVDRHLYRMVGFGSSDLPDWDYRGCHDSDEMPVDVAREVACEAGWEL